MTIYERWIKKAYNEKGQAIKKYWDEYIPSEQKIYEDIIENKQTEISGTIKSIAEKYGIQAEYVCGFLDGISEVMQPPFEVKELEEDTPFSFSIDLKELFMKMVEFKAEHLYKLPQWNKVFSAEEQRDMYYDQKKSGTIVKQPEPSRNDPCPCGSGKKFKKCCGLA